MKILMTGATGLIGKELGKALAKKGHNLVVVARDAQKSRGHLPFPCEIIEGDLTKNPLQDPRLTAIDAVVNLMGEPIVGARWTDEKKKAIVESRVQGTMNLIQSVKAAPVQTFISSSAMGYYGDKGDEIMREDHAPSADFLAQVCVDWEKAAAAAPGRKVFIRTGIVLSSQGGALEKMIPPFKIGVGGQIGDGQAWMSWIHLEDIVGLYVFALENTKVTGPLNGVAPAPVRNAEFSRQLAASLGKGLGPRVPTLAIKALFGEASQAVLASTHCSAQKAMEAGYKFKFATLEPAMDVCCKDHRGSENVFYAEQFLPLKPAELFPYFQEAKNLEELTPPSLSFHIEKVSTPEIHQGTIIDYRLKIHGVPVRWKTEIDEWKPPYKFVDNQLQGPYKLWHHTHEFEEFCGGTLMRDRVRYRLPMGFLGALCGLPFVKKEVQGIFDFRRRKITSAYF